MTAELVRLPSIADGRGRMVVAERLGFDIRRVFTISTDDPDAIRGDHAHKALTEALMVVAGSAIVTVATQGGYLEFPLTEPDELLVVEPGHWITLHSFAPGTVILVLCDQVYDADDYLRDWDEYLAWCRSSR